MTREGNTRFSLFINEFVNTLILTYKILKGKFPAATYRVDSISNSIYSGLMG
jgi:hypothetical protein